MVERYEYGPHFEGGWPHQVYVPEKDYATLAAKLEETEKDRDRWREDALGKYPTQDAYDAACKALSNTKAKLERVQAELAEAVKRRDELQEAVKRHWKDKAKSGFELRSGQKMILTRDEVESVGNVVSSYCRDTCLPHGGHVLLCIEARKALSPIAPECDDWACMDCGGQTVDSVCPECKPNQDSAEVGCDDHLFMNGKSCFRCGASKGG